jgi:deoxyribose-phosphate aldolase
MQPETLTVHDVTYEQLAGTIDHSLLKPFLTLDEIASGCELAAEYEVVSVCVRPGDVPFAGEQLGDSATVVGTVVSFPHGDSATAVKVGETAQAISDGAVEVDMVLNVGWLKSGEYRRVEDDVAAVAQTCESDAILKVILENAYLSPDEIVTACKLVEAAGGDYVKTSTGYAPTGATIDDLRLMRATVSPAVKVKAAHGVRTLDALLAVIEAGADRCGATATATMLDDFRERTRS